MIDQIAETIKQTFQAEPAPASSYREASPGGSTVRPEEVSEQHRHWRELRHVYDDGSPVPGIVPDRPCVKCGMPYPYSAHVEHPPRIYFQEPHSYFQEPFLVERMQMPHALLRAGLAADECDRRLAANLDEYLTVERSEFDVERASD